MKERDHSIEKGVTPLQRAVVQQKRASHAAVRRARLGEQYFNLWMIQCAEQCRTQPLMLADQYNTAGLEQLLSTCIPVTWAAISRGIALER
jgi:hypothetical protein